LVHDINMPLKTKAKVVIAFALRLLLIAPSASRLRPMHSSVFNANPSNSVVRLQVMSILACQVSVISATVPCAKPFFSVFSSGILGRPKASILPISRPTTHREWSATTPRHLRWDRDRGHSIHRLDIHPERGITFASAEHVPTQNRAQRPSLVNSKHSDQSITYIREFEVSFQDVGGLLTPQERNSAEMSTRKSHGSMSGFLWRRASGGKSSQKSNAGSSQRTRHAPDT
jgi:hypothetical protein